MSQVRKGAIRATYVQVVLSDEVTERKMADIEDMIRKSELSEEIKETSTAIFRRLITVEAGIHGTDPELVGTTSRHPTESREMVVLLETNLDDMNPEFYDHIMEALFAAGALDVCLQPIQAKKNRPGVLLSVLCHPQMSGQLSSIIFAETTTLGIRQQAMERICLNRETVRVETPFGQVRIKVARMGDKTINLSPEYEDCRRLAVEKRKPLKEVYAAAEAAARRWRDRVQ